MIKLILFIVSTFIITSFARDSVYGRKDEENPQTKYITSQDLEDMNDTIAITSENGRTTINLLSSTIRRRDKYGPKPIHYRMDESKTLPEDTSNGQSIINYGNSNNGSQLSLQDSIVHIHHDAKTGELVIEQTDPQGNKAPKIVVSNPYKTGFQWQPVVVIILLIVVIFISGYVAIHT